MRAATGKRHNASFLVQRLNAAPVSLHPDELNSYLADCKRQQQQWPGGGRPTAPPSDRAAYAYSGGEQVILLSPCAAVGGIRSVSSSGGGGLSANDILMVGRDAYSADEVQSWAYATAASHALSGGRVVYVHAPGNGTMQLRRFAQCMEQIVTSDAHHQQQTNEEEEANRNDGDDDALEAIQRQQERVLLAMGRVDAVHCHAVEDLYVFCTAYQISTEAAPAAPLAPAVPLVIMEGCGGEGSYLYRYERAAGREVPLRHWLLCLLQRRTRCALVLVEDVSAAQQQRQQQPMVACGAEGSSEPSRFRHGGAENATSQPGNVVARVLAKESDLVVRLLAPHRHQPTPLPAPSEGGCAARTHPLGPTRREKTRPPSLFMHDADDILTLHGRRTQQQMPVGAGPGSERPAQLSAAQADEHLPVADIGGYTLVYLTFGTAAPVTTGNTTANSDTGAPRTDYYSRVAPPSSGITADGVGAVAHRAVLAVSLNSR